MTDRPTGPAAPGGDPAPRNATGDGTAHWFAGRGVRTGSCRGTVWGGIGRVHERDRGARWWPHEAETWTYEGQILPNEEGSGHG